MKRSSDGWKPDDWSTAYIFHGLQSCLETLEGLLQITSVKGTITVDELWDAFVNVVHFFDLENKSQTV